MLSQRIAERLAEPLPESTIRGALRRTAPLRLVTDPAMLKPPVSVAAAQRRPHVVVVGAGFGGLAAAKSLAGAPVDVTVIDRRNYHLFQPLLYQVATAGLSPSQIANPIRAILRRQRNCTVLMERVTGVDTTGKAVLAGAKRIPYDFLVLATGARHAYFGHDEWEPFAPGLKKIEDATAIRRRILIAFEKAEAELDPAERQRLLNFVIVGGGPTGVEMAGAIAELARKALASDFRNIDPRYARIVLVEAGPRLLTTFPEDLSEIAKRDLERLGVEVRLGARVTGCDAEGVTIEAERLPARTVIWAAGVIASPAAKWLACEKDRAGRAIVNADLSVPGHRDVYVIGDTAAVKDAKGQPVPGLAPAAKQMGRFVARAIRARVGRRDFAESFRYRSIGNLATVGRKSAVVDFGWIKLSGFVAWALWSLAHVYFLIGFRNRITVSLDWLWSYLSFGRGARLITDSTEQ